MISEKEWREKCEVILSMHKIMCHANDENMYMNWVALGVPDGTDSLEEVKELWPNDDTFDNDYGVTTSLFCELIASQTAKIQMPQKGTDFPPMLKLNGKKVIC